MDVDSILNASDSDEDDLLLDEDDDGTAEALAGIRLEDILREDDEDDEEGEEVDETEGNFYQADDGNMKSLEGAEVGTAAAAAFLFFFLFLFLFLFLFFFFFSANFDVGNGARCFS